jgi:hypothetical protein
MSTGFIKTVLISFTIGFFLVWILEVNRTDMKSSYWLLLLSITSLLTFQYYFRVRGVAEGGEKQVTATGSKAKPQVKKKKR